MIHAFDERVVGVGVEVLVRIVLVREIAPHHIDAKSLAPFQLAVDRQQIEELAIEIPPNHGRSIAVVEKLHTLHEVESILVAYETQVRSRNDEQAEGHLVPLYASLKTRIEHTPSIEPGTFCIGDFSKVVVYKTNK